MPKGHRSEGDVRVGRLLIAIALAGRTGHFAICQVLQSQPMSVYLHTSCPSGVREETGVGSVCVEPPPPPQRVRQMFTEEKGQYLDNPARQRRRRRRRHHPTSSLSTHTARLCAFWCQRRTSVWRANGISPADDDATDGQTGIGHKVGIESNRSPRGAHVKGPLFSPLHRRACVEITAATTSERKKRACLLRALCVLRTCVSLCVRSVSKSGMDGYGRIWSLPPPAPHSKFMGVSLSLFRSRSSFVVRRRQ